MRELSTGLGDVHSSRSTDGVAFWREGERQPPHCSVSEAQR